MAFGPLHNVVTLTPRDGKLEETIRAFDDFAAYVKINEPGTLQYYAINPEGGNELIIIEKYTDQDALKCHVESERFKEFQRQAVSLLQSPPIIRRAVNPWGFEDRN